MTIPIYGRATPLQMHMLGLGGEICRWYGPHSPGDEDRMKEMKSSKEALQEILGCNFGYNLESWHNYLLNSEVHSEEYKFPYAWRAVRPKILELIKDPDRIRLAHQLETSEKK